MTMDLYIGTRFVACQGPWGRRWHEPVEGLEHGLERLAQHLQAQPWWLRRRARLWWSGGLCRPFTFDVPTGAAGHEDLESVARALAPERCGIAGPCRIWVQETRPGLALAVAVAQRNWQLCLDTLKAPASRRIVPAWAAPWWSLVLRQLANTSPACVLSVRDCDSLTVVAGDVHGLTTACAYTPVASDEDAALAWLRSRALLPEPVEVLEVRLALPGDVGRCSIACWGVLRT